MWQEKLIFIIKEIILIILIIWTFYIMLTTKDKISQPISICSFDFACFQNKGRFIFSENKDLIIETCEIKKEKIK
jgi:hypothetical protein